VTDADSLTDLLAAQELSSAIVVLIAVLAFLVALWGTNIARAAAIRFGIVDHPDGGLKRHREPTPAHPRRQAGRSAAGRLGPDQGGRDHPPHVPPVVG